MGVAEAARFGDTTTRLDTACRVKADISGPLVIVATKPVPLGLAAPLGSSHRGEATARARMADATAIVDFEATRWAAAHVLLNGLDPAVL